MDKDIRVFFDKRCIRFVQSSAGSNGSSHILVGKKPEWPDILSFLRSGNKKLVFVSDHPEVYFRLFKTFFRPLEAAGGLTRNMRGEWLFIFRNGRWDLPKGMLEQNESSKQAAIREVQEECGIADVRVLRSLPLTYHIYPDKDGSWILKKTHWYFMETYEKATPTPQISEGITKVEWRDPEDNHDIMQDTYGNIRLLLDFCMRQKLHK